MWPNRIIKGNKMRLSQYFLPVLKETPKEAQIASHRLMLRAGMIQQSSAGIYSWLPLGKRVLDKIANIVREEQNRAGALEILMPTIQPAEIWQESGRYDDYGAEMLESPTGMNAICFLGQQMKSRSPIFFARMFVATSPCH